MPWPRRWLLLEALCWLGLARLAVLRVPFRWIAPLLGRAERVGGQLHHGDGRLATDVGWALRVVSPRTPWKSNCLAQVVAGQRMLFCRGEATALYLRLRREGEEVVAHAWLRAGGLVVCGGPGEETFTVLTTFVWRRMEKGGTDEE